MPPRQVRTVQTVQLVYSTGAVLGDCRHARCCAGQSAWSRQCRKLRFRSFGVVAVPVVVQRQVPDLVQTVLKTAEIPQLSAEQLVFCGGAAVRTLR